MLASRIQSVHGHDMHYLEAGSGAPILFLHGNPTSSELWRDVIPWLADDGRCLALDLIGMGASAKPAIAYRFGDHAAFLAGFIEALGLRDITLVAHDWGVALAADYVARHPDRVRAFAFLEGRLEPLPGWDAFDKGGRALFRSFRTGGEGERLIVSENILIDIILQAGTERELTPDEMATYRSPYLDPSTRLPLLQWTREIPVGGEPADVAARMTAAFASLAVSSIPKLAIHASPGAVIEAGDLARWSERLPNLSFANVGSGLHFLPHDRPGEIGQAVQGWLRSSSIGV